MAFDRLIRAIDEKKNPTVAGLDPKLDYVPEFIKKDSREKYGDTLEAAADALLTFNKGLIDSLCDVVAAVKPQCAYYEMYGWQGVKALYDTIAYAKEKGLFVITDGKRNDIGTTMEAYAAAHIGKTEAFGKTFESFSADALTVNGYLGSDGINPLLNICKEEDKGIFVLVKTSNPSSGELQDRLLGGKTVYETMGEMCENWGKDSITDYGYSCVGAVVGATYPEMGRVLRRIMPHAFILVPGYGAQGGKGADLVHFFQEDGLGAIVNSSRGIIAAWQSSQYEEYGENRIAEAARTAVLDMKKDISDALNM